MENSNVGKKKSKRIFYFDALRCLAIIAVICVHVFMPTRKYVLAGYGVIPTLNWFINDFFVANRIGVDLFLMLAGALSLGRDWTIPDFLGKRIPRIVGPFLFWGLILSIGFISLSFYYPKLFHMVTAFDIGSIVSYIGHAYLAECPGFGPYWFFWMILGTYLIMPIFNKWLANSDLKEAEYFLAIWLITTIFDFTINQPFPVKLTYFVSPIGLVVLGYYLRYTERKIFKNLHVPALLLIVGIACSMSFSYFYSNSHHFVWFNRYSLFTVMEVAGIFLLFRNISELNLNVRFFSNPDGVFKKSVFSIAKYSYGMYLIHNFFISIIYPTVKFYYPAIGYKLMVSCGFFGALLLSWGLMALLNRVPYLNQVIGAK